MRLLTIMFPSRNLRHTLQCTVVVVVVVHISHRETEKRVVHTGWDAVWIWDVSFFSTLWNIYFAFNFIFSSKNNCYVGTVPHCFCIVVWVWIDMWWGNEWIRVSTIDTSLKTGNKKFNKNDWNHCAVWTEQSRADRYCV